MATGQITGPYVIYNIILDAKHVRAAGSRYCHGLATDEENSYSIETLSMCDDEANKIFISKQDQVAHQISPNDNHNNICYVKV